MATYFDQLLTISTTDWENVVFEWPIDQLRILIIIIK